MQESANEDKRLDFRVPVDFVLNKYVQGRPFLCRAVNLSRCGLLLHRVFEPKNNETKVGLQFELPGEDRVITCGGEIVYEHDWLSASGIRFTDVDSKHQKLIDAFIRGHLDWPKVLA